MIKAIKNLFMVLASQDSVLGNALKWLYDVQKIPIIAAVLAVVSALMVFGWRNLGKPVWEELKPRAAKGLATWVNVTVKNLFSGFHCRYNQQVIYAHRVFPVRGLLTPGQDALKLDRMFIEVDIAPSHVLQIRTNPTEMKSLSGSRSMWTFLGRLKKQDASALAILGPPGCGKTTLLKHLALTFASKRHRRFRMRSSTPVFLF